MKDFLTDLGVKMATYCVAALLAIESIRLYGDKSLLTTPQFNWIALVFVAIVFELWGIHKGRTLKAFKKEENEDEDEDNA